MITIEKNPSANKTKPESKAETQSVKVRRQMRWPKYLPKPVMVEITAHDNERLKAAAEKEGIPDWNLHWLLLNFALTKLEAGEIITGRGAFRQL